jgi:hypothetical protein
VNVAYRQGPDTSKKVNNPLFKKMTQISDNLFEIETAKQVVKWDLPLQIGFFVYQYAKLRMLEFYYDFIDKFVDRADFQLCEMDTDSLYLALSTRSLAEAVRPELRKDFYKVYAQWFPSEVCRKHRAVFIKTLGTSNPTCQACQATRLFDKRTPGLFKMEYEGDGIISLCSKTYHCFGAYDKTSTKGLTKHHNKLDKSHFQEVLDTNEAQGGTNIGFKLQGSSMYTYTQHRKSLSYFYIKRKVHGDNVTTSPLAI